MNRDPRVPDKGKVSRKTPVVRSEGSKSSGGGYSSLYNDLIRTAMQDPNGFGAVAENQSFGAFDTTKKDPLREASARMSDVSGAMLSPSANRPMTSSLATSGGRGGLSGVAPQDPYIQEDSRYKDRAKFDQSLAEQAMNSQTNARVSEEERLMKLRMEMLNQLLGGGVGSLGSRGKTATSTQDTSGGEYQNIGGRPVWMPTSSKTRTTSNERGMSSEALLQALLSMIDG